MDARGSEVGMRSSHLALAIETLRLFSSLPESPWNEHIFCENSRIQKAIVDSNFTGASWINLSNLIGLF